MVQEQSTTNWAGGGWGTVTTSSANAVAQCSFTMWSIFGGLQGPLGACHLNQSGRVGQTNNAQSSFSDCQFTGGTMMIDRWLNQPDQLPLRAGLLIPDLRGKPIRVVPVRQPLSWWARAIYGWRVPLPRCSGL